MLGPLELDRVRRLILKNQITGDETAREHPDGEWVSISRIAVIAELLLMRAQGKLGKDDLPLDSFENVNPAASTQILAVPALDPKVPPPAPKSSNVQDFPTSPAAGAPDEEHDATQFADEGTQITEIGGDEPLEVNRGPLAPGEDLSKTLTRNLISQEPTIVLVKPTDEGKTPKEKTPRDKKKEWIRATIVALLLGSVWYEVFLVDDDPGFIKVEAVRPALPKVIVGKNDPAESTKLYNAGIQYHMLDHVAGYRRAAEAFNRAVSLDPGNVKALAMLASSYLNLIDSSNKDENYFQVISKLIEMSRAKSVDLAETVIADVEYFLNSNRAEAAQSRIVEYAKNHQNQQLAVSMFYYLALVFQARGDIQSAVRFLGQIPENKITSARVFYLRGQIAERVGDPALALIEYQKALKLNKDHVKSRLRIADLLHHEGRLKDASKHLAAILERGSYLPPRELARAYYLHGLASELKHDFDRASTDVEQAVRLDRQNHDYLLELYALRARGGEKQLRAEARMYANLGEGERLLKKGKIQEALVQFLQARQANDSSPIPPTKIGDMFKVLNDLGNAKVNYKLAAERAPASIEIWSKYIDVLIQSYEWEDAQKAMNRFRNLPVPQSAIDKAAADMYEKQGRSKEAQVYYRKAMAREYIDPGVYIAYAKSLMTSKNYTDAPFFFALALRFDPLNTDALVGSAKCVAATDSIDRAINMLQDEMTKGSGSRAELLSAIAEFQIQKGNWDLAQGTIEQAKLASPEYATPWKLQAQIYLNNESTDKKALDKALFAYQSYSDRNPSDPSGYVERYRLYMRKAQFEKAAEELNKVYGIYPKYPNLHFYKGLMYSAQGNHKLAIEEMRGELQNNPDNPLALIQTGREYIEMGAPTEALEALNRAMKMSPQSADARHWAGYANYLLKNYEGAAALYSTAIQLDPANPMLYKRLAAAYKATGNAPGARAAARKYLEMEPDAVDRSQFEQF